MDKSKFAAEELDKLKKIENYNEDLMESNTEILEIVNYCKNNTIEKTMAKDDAEIAIEYLMGKYK